MGGYKCREEGGERISWKEEGAAGISL